MKFLPLAMAFLPVCGAWAQQTLVLDFSASMAGFSTPRDNRLPGMLQRLAVLLSPSAPLRVYGLAGRGGGILRPQTWQAAAAAYADPKSFVGSTPLVQAIEEITAPKGSTEVVILTDGMEDSGNLGRVASALGNLVKRKWGIGLIAVSAPFHGIYYTEHAITDSLFQDVEKTVRARNGAWSIKKAAAGCKAGECYEFAGQRPALFLCLSGSGSARALMAAVRQALAEMKMAPLGAASLAPFHASPVLVNVEAPAATRARIKLPAVAGQDLMCAEPVRDRLDMMLRVGSGPASGQPSTLRVTGFELLEKPNWVLQPLKAPDTTGAQPFQVICPKGGFFEAVSQAPGTLRVRYDTAVQVAPGWWDKWTAENAWQYPFKVYKLAEIVRTVHAQAAAAYKPAPVEFSLGMKVQN